MSIINIDPKNFKKEIEDDKTPVIVDFWAPWCGPCQMMEPVFSQVSDEFKGKMRFAKINTQDYPELAEPFGIRGIPCLIIMEKGKEKQRLLGFRSKDQLMQEVIFALNSR
jgi:thioredoxin 2